MTGIEAVVLRVLADAVRPRKAQPMVTPRKPFTYEGETQIPGRHRFHAEYCDIVQQRPELFVAVDAANSDAAKILRGHEQRNARHRGTRNTYRAARPAPPRAPSCTAPRTGSSLRPPDRGSSDLPSGGIVRARSPVRA